MKKFAFPLILVSLAATAQANSTVTPPTQFLVPGSQQKDFGVACWDAGKETFSIHKNKTNDYRHARNIVFTDLGGGRVAISLLYGTTTADTPATYLTSSSERCETYQQ